jgi:hypothetical protein
MKQTSVEIICNNDHLKSYFMYQKDILVYVRIYILCEQRYTHLHSVSPTCMSDRKFEVFANFGNLLHPLQHHIPIIVKTYPSFSESINSYILFFIDFIDSHTKDFSSSLPGLDLISHCTIIL